jgi:hypothetical protein
MSNQENKQKNKNIVTLSWSGVGFVIGLVIGYVVFNSVVSGALLGLGLGLAMGGGSHASHAYNSKSKK